MKNKNLMVVVLLIAGFLALILIIGKINSSISFSKQVNQLFSLSKNISQKTFNTSQLNGLPEPVQHYFNHVLKEGQPYISFVRMIHTGRFKPGADKDWVDINGEQYATTEKPGFIWKGTTATFSARDLYIDDKGKLTVSLFSLITVVNGSGDSYNQGELLRWLGESVLYPTNLLPGEHLKWSAIDDQSARLTFTYNGLSLFYIVTFNDDNEIIKLETRRYMDEKHLETWVIKLDTYKLMNGIHVPTRFEVLWRLEKGDLSYANFTMKKIEYDIPNRF